MTRIPRALTYVGTAVSGFGAVYLTPNTLASTLDYTLTIAWGWAAMVLSIPAMFGAITGWYRWERGSVPFIVTALTVYFVTVLGILPTTPTRLAQAGVLFALIFALTARMVELAQVSKKHKADRRLKIKHSTRG